MSTASNAAPALARQPFFDAPDNFAPDEGQRTGRPAGTLAGSCVLAAAVLDAVADLAGDSGSEAALLAKSGAAKTLESRHDALWNALRTDFLSPRGDARPAYAGALGHGLLATPCGLQAGADGALWATSLGGEGLAVLPPDGGQGRLVPLPGCCGGRPTAPGRASWPWSWPTKGTACGPYWARPTRTRAGGPFSASWPTPRARTAGWRA
jgi:hypothetical protein